MLVKDAQHCRIHDPLARAADLGRKRSLHRFSGFHTVDEILHRVLSRWLQGINRDVTTNRVLDGLQVHCLLEIVAGDASLLPDDHEATLGLRLVGPRVGMRSQIPPLGIVLRCSQPCAERKRVLLLSPPFEALLFW